MALIQAIDEKTVRAFVDEVAVKIVPAVEPAVARVIDPVLQQIQGLREEIAALPLSIRDAVLPLIDRLEAAGKAVVRQAGTETGNLTFMTGRREPSK